MPATSSWLAFLLARGARADIQTNDGTTPLGRAAQIGWLEGATQLLARGAQVDLANVRGETPLILAVQARHLSAQDRLAMIRLLIGQRRRPGQAGQFRRLLGARLCPPEPARRRRSCACWGNGLPSGLPAQSAPTLDERRRRRHSTSSNAVRPGSMSPISRRAARRAKRSVSALRRAAASLRNGAARRISAS